MDQRVSFRLGLIALVAASLAGCGRKGPLELPPDTTGPSQAQATKDAAAPPAIDNPALIQPPNKFMDQSASAKLEAASRKPVHAINGTPAPAKKPFMLDPLL